MILPKISKFERRIVVAILLCALTPFLISVLFIPQIIEGRLVLGMHPKVSAQLEDSAVFFKEFFDAKKSEYSARAEAIAKDPILLRACAARDRDDIRARIAALVDDHPEIRSVTVRAPDGGILAAVEATARSTKEPTVPKTLSLPVGVGEAPVLEIVFVIPERYFDERARAEEIATMYATALELETSRSREFFFAFVLISATFVVLAVVTAFLLSRAVTKRIARLALATERVGKGESGFTIPLRGNDEITELSDRFNRMIEEVADARNRIVYLEKVSGWQEFARRLAHEIKNPLTPIRLAIHELRQRAPAGDAAFTKLVNDATDVVEEEIRALTRLVDEFSQFARLPEVRQQPVELRGFLREFLAAYNNFEPDAVVELIVPDDPVVVAIDGVLFRRVLANLVTNAIQAAGAGKARVWIRCAASSSTRQVTLAIDDNGPGISAHLVEKVFEPYYTTKSDGTGLGLAIVKKIVLQHDGAIAIERSERGGASFVITLERTNREPKDGLIQHASG